jgi:methionyl-tRNA formyltransferase
MQMDEGLDTGDILASREIAIGEQETVGELFDRLAILGKDLLLSLLPHIYAKDIVSVPQDHSLASYAEKIRSEDQVLDFSQSTKQVLLKIRGLSPTPCAVCRTEKDGKLLKVFSAEKAEGSFNGEAGAILSVKPHVLVKTADGAVILETVQPEGKGRMSARDAANGRKLAEGERLIP